MSATELDPLFFKGLRLLHSKSKDSEDQLKQLLDEAIAQSKQSSNYKDRTYSFGKLDADSKLLKKLSRDSEISIINPKQSLDDSRDRKAEKRQFEKIKQESLDSMYDAKIPKLETPQVFSSVHFSNLLQYPPSPDLPKLDQYAPRKDDDTDSSDENCGDADDFAREMGLACVICKQIDVSLGNQLIECQECHSLYHQECHRPPATDHDINDPRKVWYCAKCMKNMKKMATKTQKTSKPSVTTVPKELPSQTKINKPDTSAPTLILPFKRSELKAPVSQANSSTSANKPIGLAGLAANFSGRVTTASSSTSSQSSRPLNSKASAPLNLKAFTSAPSGKTSTTPTPLTSASKTSSSSVFPALTSSSAPANSTVPISKVLLSSSTLVNKGVFQNPGAQPMPSISRAASGSNNGSGGHSKTSSCSPLMSADKRVQMMKKKAAKLQEKRRLSTK